MVRPIVFSVGRRAECEHPGRAIGVRPTDWTSTTFASEMLGLTAGGATVANAGVTIVRGRLQGDESGQDILLLRSAVTPRIVRRR